MSETNNDSLHNVLTLKSTSRNASLDASQNNIGGLASVKSQGLPLVDTPMSPKGNDTAYHIGSMGAFYCL